MGEGLIRITPDGEKAKSIMKMVDTTIEMINAIDADKFSSNVTKEYYDVIRELASVILLLDGYKTYGENAHKNLFEYIDLKYSEFTEQEISLMDDLRIKRNKIAYDGFFISRDYIRRKAEEISIVIGKLKGIIDKKMQG